jgi:pimeloyl-ACP methyl ester carboxylesterase
MPTFQPISYQRALSILWACIVCPLPALLLFSFATVQGGIFAIGGLLLGAAPLLAFISPENLTLRKCSVAALALWLIITVWLWRVSPDGRPHADARVQNCYADGGWHYQRQALGALLPEVDQFMLGFQIVPALDPLLTWRQTRTLAAETRTIYAALEADEDFHALGSVMPDAYDDLWGLRTPPPHYYLYIPQHLDRRTRAPALVFLHGSGGNFKSYVWLLSRIADDLGMILVAPSFGMGDWDAKRAPSLVAKVLADAARRAPLDESRMHLVGLSNGGLGVSRLAASAIADRFCSLTFLSPVCDQAALKTPAFRLAWNGKPVLVISGAEDDRVPLSYVKESVAILKTAGASVEFSIYDDANHFLFFSHRERCLPEMKDWLSTAAGNHASAQ